MRRIAAVVVRRRSIILLVPCVASIAYLHCCQSRADLVQAARRGVQRFSGSKLYCTMLPCKYRRESFYDGFCTTTRKTAAEAGCMLVSYMTLGRRGGTLSGRHAL